MKYNNFLFPLLIILCFATNFNQAIAQVCTGDVFLTTQAQVNAFNCTSVTGRLTIGPSTDIVDLTPISGLIAIGEDLKIETNAALTNLNGLGSVTTVVGNLRIDDNAVLANVDSLVGITSVGEDISINVNPLLTNLDGLKNIQTVGDDIYISFNDALSNLAGLTGVISVGGDLTVEFNAALAACCGVGFLFNDGSVSGTVNVNSNIAGCNTMAEINAVICCPTFIGLAPIVPSILNSACSSNGVQSIGQLTAPTTNCPRGSLLQYSTDGSTFTNNLPTYNSSKTVTISTRCACQEDANITSAIFTVNTMPGLCKTIPTLSQWGLLLFGLLILNLGVLFVKNVPKVI